MLSNKLKKYKKVFLIGIGGISMSAIAVILKKNGISVLGSDLSESENVKKLRDEGIKVFIGQKKENIDDGIDLVVYSKAIHDDNEEIVEAKKRNIEIVSRSQILGIIMENYNKRICISGTHGKTTTTALIGKVMLDMKFEPTINVGGIVDEIGGNSYISDNNNLFIAEACEYTNSFLDFCPSVAVVTNVEEDHLDFFKDLADIRNSFRKFIHLLPDDGILVINNKIENIDYFTKDLKTKVYTYGDDEDADYYFNNIKYDDLHYQSFDVYFRKEFVGRMRQKLIGKHNALNFLAAFATLRELGIDFNDIKKSLEDFKGAKRRLEVKGVIDGVTFIDDYAHHPTEIKASLSALNELKYNNLYLIFQPHTYTRTKALLNEFVDALKGVKYLILAKIYPARESDIYGISSLNIKNKIIENNSNFCEYLETFKEIQEYLKNVIKPGDLVVTMGAGDVYKLFDLFNVK